MVKFWIVSNNSNFIKGADNAPVLIMDWCYDIVSNLVMPFMDCLQMLLIRLLPVLPLPGIMWNFLLKFWSVGLTPEVLNKFACIIKWANSDGFGGAYRQSIYF
jgi:hypothetical protein